MTLFKKNISSLKVKKLLLAIVGILFLSFYIGIFLSKIFYPLRTMLFIMIIFLLLLYWVYRFNQSHKTSGKKPYNAGHIGIGALLLFVFFAGVQTNHFTYYHRIGIIGLLLLIPFLWNVCNVRK